MSSPPGHESNALIVIGDKLEPKPYLQSLVATIGRENSRLPAEQQVRYVVCADYSELALALKQSRNQIRMILLGTGLRGKIDMLGRLIGGRISTVLIVDPELRVLSDEKIRARQLAENLERLGNVLICSEEATSKFFEPIVKSRVVGAVSFDGERCNITPDERSELLERRLESVTRFPSLPETQQRVSALGEMARPKDWAEAIDRDLPVRKVILKSLNSAHYGFRHRVTTIEQAVSLATTRTVRELVMACTVQRLFRQVPAARIEQFWKHSVATAFFAKLFTLPTEVAEQSPQQRTEFERFGLGDEAREALGAARLWTKFELEESSEDTFTAGLLHDIGKVTMVLCFEETLLMFDPLVESGVKQLNEKDEIWSQSCKTIERLLLLDLDHQIIGGRIARRWGFGPALHQVITQHHDVQRGTADLVKIVALADLAANTLHSYPFREKHHPLVRFMALVQQNVDSGSSDLDGVLEGRSEELERILQGLEAPSALWRLIDGRSFFKLCHLVGPAIRKATTSFLRMTSAVG